MASIHINPVASEDIEFFTGAGVKVIQADKELEPKFNVDVFGKYRGNSQVILFPQNTEQVSKVLSHCNQRRIGVVTQGGNSGTAGGAIASKGEVLLCLRDMNKVRDIDAISGVVVADSGCILEDLDNYVQEFGYIVPIDLGAKKKCMIGGNVSTNAGGLRYLRYGSLHGNVLGLEVVLPDGRILDSLFTLKKDASGYDVKQLFIGAEGTLGVVTAVSISLAPKPKSTQLAILGLQDFAKIQRAFVLARQNLGEIVSAFEFWEKRCNELVVEYQGYDSLLATPHEFYVLIETRGSSLRHDAEKMDAYLDSLRSDSITKEARVIREANEIEQAWLFRSQMAEAHGKSGCMHVYDFSLPSKYQHQLLVAVKDHLRDCGVYGQPDSPVKDVTIFGHIGDDNIHLQVVSREFGGVVEEAMEPWAYEWVGGHGGSVAAEHGLGKHKGEFLKYSKSPAVINAMKSIKQMLDPNEIMNPGKHISRRFADAELASEAIYTLLSFVGVYHDGLLARAAKSGLLVDKEGRHVDIEVTPLNRYQSRLSRISNLYRIASLVLSGLQFSEKLIEMIVVKKYGEKLRWRVVTWIEIIKILSRFSLLHLSGRRMVTGSVVPERLVDPAILGTAKQAALANSKSPNVSQADASDPWKGGRSGLKFKSVRDILSKTEGNADLGGFLTSEAKDAESVAPALSLIRRYNPLGLAGELLFILRPLIYVITMRKMGRNAWKPWALSLLVELVSRQMIRTDLYSGKDSAGTAAAERTVEKEELSRRKWLLLYYFLRSPFFDRFTESRLTRVAEWCNNKPLLSLVGALIQDYQPLWQQYYFYTAAS
ncbi:D-lactate ferricytochrome c oxidoreductase [Dipsacomyces acuminosporus]|nr:D-lactate ferricytochrome c oxidoreductase [Dipsacomyces acuminosporus]